MAAGGGVAGLPVRCSRARHRRSAHMNLAGEAGGRTDARCVRGGYGRNFAGVAQIDLGVGARGERIVFRYGELLNKDGTVNGMTGVCGQIKRAGMGGAGAPAVAEQRDEYIRRGGEPERYRPRFTWHGFRYVQIEGLASRPRPEDVTAYALASAVKDASRFECSEPMLNRLHRVCRDTFLGNLMGVQSDCPARERFGYGADIAATTEAFIFQFDMRTF